VNFVELFNDSYERVAISAADSERFFSTFYENFLAASASVARKFEGTNLTRQRLMLRESLILLIDFSVHREESPALRKVALLHSKADRDIPPELYETWLEALFETLGALDPRFSASVELAWRIVLAPGIEYMRFQYDRVI
jgi:hemoglobin-like flavoprotein